MSFHQYHVPAAGSGKQSGCSVVGGFIILAVLCGVIFLTFSMFSDDDKDVRRRVTLSVPKGAKVAVNGEPKPFVKLLNNNASARTHFYSFTLPPGKHRISVQEVGGKNRNFPVAIEPGEDVLMFRAKGDTLERVATE